MSPTPEPFVTRGMIVAAAFAVLGALVIAFVFAPLMSPGIDPLWAFAVSLAFLLIVMLAAQAARSQR